MSGRMVLSKWWALHQFLADVKAENKPMTARGQARLSVLFLISAASVLCVTSGRMMGPIPRSIGLGVFSSANGVPVRGTPPPVRLPLPDPADVISNPAGNNGATLTDLTLPAGSKAAHEEILILSLGLKTAREGAVYHEKLSALGGVGPYQWEITSGILPQGLFLDKKNGVVYGTPLEASVEQVTIEVRDSQSAFRAKDFQIIVRQKEAIMADVSEEAVKGERALPKGLVGVFYYYELPVTWEGEPYPWQLGTSQLPEGMSFFPDQGILAGAPQQPGRFSFLVRTTDANGKHAELSYRFEIGTSPLYLTTAGLPEGNVGLAYSAKLKAQGGMPPYRWKIVSGILPKGLSLAVKEGAIQGIPEEAGSADLVLGLMDEEKGYDSAKLRLVIAGGSLTILKQDLPRGVVGQDYHAVFQAQGGRVPYRWSFSSTPPSATTASLPEGLECQQDTGVLAGVPKKKYTGTLQVSVTDGNSASTSHEFKLSIIEKSLAMVLPNTLRFSVGEGVAFYFNAEGGTPDYLWSSGQGMPEGFFLLPNGAFIGTPAHPERSVLSLVVTDQTGEHRRGQVPVVIPEEPLVLETHSLPRGERGVNYRAPLTASGGSLPYEWRLGSGVLPGGLSLDGSLGIFSGTPMESGVFSIDLLVRDAVGNEAHQNLAFNIAYEPLRAITSSLANGRLHMPYSGKIEVTGGFPDYTWQIVSGGLPEGIHLTSSDGTLQGIPTHSAQAQFEVLVTDASGEEIRFPVALTIEGTDLEIINASLEEGVAGRSYYADLNVTGGIGPYHWFLFEGSLPPPLSLDEQTGEVAGVPERASQFSFAAGVRDGQEMETKKSFSLLIRPQPFQIETRELEMAHVGQLYEMRLAAIGGVSPYIWSLASGELPEGISLDGPNGLLTGVPVALVDGQSFVIRATDQEGTKVTQALTMNVLGQKPQPVSFTASSVSDSKVGLAWLIPADPAIHEVGVYRAAGQWPELRPEFRIYAGREDNRVDSNLMNGSEYFYIVAALDSSGQVSDVLEGSKVHVIPRAVGLTGKPDPYADHVVSFSPLAPNTFGSTQLPANVLGPPRGNGSGAPQNSPTELLSLTARANDDSGRNAPYGGAIILEMNDNMAVNGPGADFTVFENAFYVGGDFSNRWMEPAVISVSQDGVHFYQIPFDYVPHFDLVGTEVTSNPFSYASGFAGINPVYSNGSMPDPTDPGVSGGDSFDLSSITEKNLTWIKFVKIQSTGDNWLVDRNGDRVRHPRGLGSVSGSGNSGFDLDAVSSVHS